MSSEQEDNFIKATDYARKYGFDYAKFRPKLARGDFIAEKRTEYDPISKRHTKRWYVLDVPPKDHPDYKEPVRKPLSLAKRRSNQNYNARFQDLAVVFLERFQANADPGKSTFSQSELAIVLETTPVTVARWATDGIEGFGQLPRLAIPDDVQGVKPSQRVYYYHRLHVVAFLKGECAPGKKRKKTIDDALIKADEAAIAREVGYYVYDRNKVYPATYEGFMKWIKDNIYRYDHKQGRWIPFVPNEIQREFYKNVFALDENGLFKHRFIRLSRPRGDFKSFDTVLIFLFRFFNMPNEKILLAANSRDQSDFALFRIARDIIWNSPNLAAMASTPALEVKDKEIVLMSGKKNVFSIIQPIASKIGTLSNATCICFSEIYKSRDEDFIVELEGSIRAVRNAMTIIESTVSPKDHYFYREYEAYLEGNNPQLYFQYYCDKHYNPDITEQELAKYKRTMKPHDYRRFFVNRWEDAAYGLFTKSKILEMGHMGIDGILRPSEEFSAALNEIVDLEAKLNTFEGTKVAPDLYRQIKQIKARLTPVDSLYTLPATREDLNRLEEIYDTKFLIGMGLDRAKQMDKRSDRSALVTIAKGVLSEFVRIYFVLDVFMPPESKMRYFVERIIELNHEFGWIDYIELEEYLSKDIWDWCVESGFEASLSKQTYPHQDQIFDQLWQAVESGCFKCPTVPVWVDDNDRVHHEPPPKGRADIVRFEMTEFEHDPPKPPARKGYFGSPYKKKSGRTPQGKPKDDVVFGMGHATFAANRGDEPLGSLFGRGADGGAQEAIINTDVIGDYEVLREQGPGLGKV